MDVLISISSTNKTKQLLKLIHFPGSMVVLTAYNSQTPKETKHSSRMKSFLQLHTLKKKSWEDGMCSPKLKTESLYLERKMMNEFVYL